MAEKLTMPTVGRIVQVRLKDRERQVSRGAKPGDPPVVERTPRWAAAIVTEVWSETCVNLQVFGVPGAPHPFPDCLPPSVVMGEDVGCWRWPPRA